MRKISISKDFSEFPGGRYRKHGPYSGEEFRESILIPAFRSHEKLVVNIDGTKGFPSSFLEEAFGGLLRRGISIEEINANLKIEFLDRHNKPYYDQIWDYINKQAGRSEKVS